MGLSFVVVVLCWSPQVLQYVSTTYCFTKAEVLEERFYPTEIDWRTMIRLAETQDEHTMNVLSQK